MSVYVRPLKELVPPELVTLLGENVIIKRVVAGIAEAARDHWIRLAAEAFHRTRRDYVKGIQPVKLRGMDAVISLVGSWPNSLENGMSAYDQRSTLLGPNVPVVPPGQRGKHPIWKKVGRSGAMQETGDYYRHIPFRHLSPRSTSALGTKMGAALEKHMPQKDARRMGRMVYQLAKELQPYQTVYGGHPEPAGSFAQGGYHGIDEDDLAEESRVGRARRLTFPKEAFGDAADVLTKHYGGMVRSEKKYQTATQSQYVTFRTISTRGPAWKHPGLPGQKLAEKVSAHVARIAEQSFAAFAQGSKG